MTVNCPNCQASIAFPDPAPHCVNHTAYSAITLTHERGIDCAACGAFFTLAIAQCHLDFTLIPTERPIESSIIVPALKFPTRLSN